MKSARILTVAVLFLAACSTPAWGWGLYSWYGGYTTATATGWNGGTAVTWTYTPTWTSWAWGSPAYARAYTNTYPFPQSQTSWGWPAASAQAHSAWAGRTADAWASAFNAGWPWWGTGGYAWASAQTTGSPSYATAYARANSGWGFRFWVPKAWWNNTWVPVHGWRIPFYLRWWWWGWFDGDMDQADMAVAMNLKAYDPETETWQTILDDGFRDNGDGSYTQLGSQLAPADLVFNPDVGGTGHPGWDIIGRDGNLETDQPYEFAFLITAVEVGGDVDNIELEVILDIDGYIGQAPGPEACCFEDGTCEQLDPAECEALTGTFQGPFTSCAGDDPNGIDDVCETDVGACCLSDGSCVNVPLAECQQDGGDFAGVGAGCRGDVDQNGIDDMCEITEAVPALTGPGLLLMAGLLVVAGVVILRRWRAQTA